MSAIKLNFVPRDKGIWHPPIVFIDEYHERVIQIASTSICFKYLKDDWHLHGDLAIYYDALKAVMNALDGTGSHEDARSRFLRALGDVDATVLRC